MEETNLVCPLCRKRIGSWLRRARKTRTLVDDQYWQAIQDQFPQQVQNKQNDIDEDLIGKRTAVCYVNKRCKSLFSSRVAQVVHISARRDPQGVRNRAGEAAGAGAEEARGGLEG